MLVHVLPHHIVFGWAKSKVICKITWWASKQQKKKKKIGSGGGLLLLTWTWIFGCGPLRWSRNALHVTLLWLSPMSRMLWKPPKLSNHENQLTITLNRLEVLLVLSMNNLLLGSYPPFLTVFMTDLPSYMQCKQDIRTDACIIAASRQDRLADKEIICSDSV